MLHCVFILSNSLDTIILYIWRPWSYTYITLHHTNIHLVLFFCHRFCFWIFSFIFILIHAFLLILILLKQTTSARSLICISHKIHTRKKKYKQKPKKLNKYITLNYTFILYKHKLKSTHKQIQMNCRINRKTWQKKIGDKLSSDAGKWRTISWFSGTIGTIGVHKSGGAKYTRSASNINSWFSVGGTSCVQQHWRT